MMKANTRDTAQSPPDLISDRNVKQFSMALLLELQPHADHHTRFAFPRTAVQLMIDSVTLLDMLLMIGDAVTGLVDAARPGERHADLRGRRVRCRSPSSSRA